MGILQLLAILTTFCTCSTPSGATAADGSSGSGDRRRALKRSLLSSPLVRRGWTGLMVLDYGLQVAPRLYRARRSSAVVIVVTTLLSGVNYAVVFARHASGARAKTH